MASAGRPHPRLQVRCAPLLGAMLLAVAVMFGPRIARADDVPLTELDRAALAQRLVGIDAMVRELKITSDANAKAAEAKRAQCSDQVTGFDIKLGQLTVHRKELDKRSDELFVNMARSTEQNRNESAVVEKLRRDVEAARNSMAELEHNLVLLDRWWWVPGYGQYLAIKTLVNNEIGQLQSIREELSDHHLQLANHEELVRGARRLICEVVDERKNLTSAGTALQCMNGIALKNSVEFRKKTIALLDREEFWLKLNDIGSITVDGQRQALLDRLQARPSARVEAQIVSKAQELQAALDGYKQKLEEGWQYLEAMPRDFCALEEPGHQCAKPPDYSMSFERSCTDMRIEGDGTVLSAVCQDGQRSSTSLRGITNQNGTLRQGGSEWTFGYDQTPSSFQKSCRDIFICGNTLMASCAKGDGTWLPTSLDLKAVITMNGKVFMQSND